MQNSHSDRLYRRLAAWGAKGWRFHLAALVAGLLLLVVKPASAPQPKENLKQVAAGAVVLGLALLLLGHFLAVFQPALHQLGHLNGYQLSTLALCAVLAWRYLAGRKVLALVRLIPNVVTAPEVRA